MSMLIISLRRNCAVLLLLACFFVLTTSLRAQEATAALVGSVSDPSGASVAGVLIRVVNLDTNTAREAQTDASGAYSLPFLPAGDYTITASSAGFQSQKVDKVTLQVQQTARMDF